MISFVWLIRDMIEYHVLVVIIAEYLAVFAGMDSCTINRGIPGMLVDV